MQPDVIMARYGEVGIKSAPVRRRFEQILQQNIEMAFETEGVDCIVRRLRGRFFVTSSDVPKALNILRKVFGLTSVSPCVVRSSRLEELLPEVGRYAREAYAGRPHATTFAIRSRRSGTHPYSSQDLARQAGGAVLDEPATAHLKVDLDEPDLEISIEVRDDKAYIFEATFKGPGGLPMGSQGKVLVLLKDLHSLVAAWLMLKRGCSIVPVHFEGITGQRERAEAYEAWLRTWYVRARLIHLPHGEANEFPRDATCVLCMRQMVRKAGLLARRKKCKALVTGEAFSSTTVDHLTRFGGLTEVPILRPVLGTTPELVHDFLKAMGFPLTSATHFFEPCPLRSRIQVTDERIMALEQELGLEARAHSAVRERPAQELEP